MAPDRRDSITSITIAQRPGPRPRPRPRPRPQAGPYPRPPKTPQPDPITHISTPQPLIPDIRPARCACALCAPYLHLCPHPFDVEPGRSPPILYSGQHDPLLLALHDINAVPPVAADLTCSQRAAISRFARWKSNFWPENGRTDAPTRTLLATPMEVFDKLFFMEKLPWRLVRLETVACDAEGKDQAQYRAQTVFEQGINCTRAIMKINIAHRLHRPDDLSRNMSKLLNTLLHEMCHAYLGLYSCHAGSSCPSMTCSAVPFKQNHGSTQHGRAWQWLAKVIEDRAPLLLEGFAPQLGRYQRILVEIEKGGFRSSSCEIEKMFGDKGATVIRVWLGKTSWDDDEVMQARLSAWVGNLPASSNLRRRRSMACLEPRGLSYRRGVGDWSVRDRGLVVNLLVC